MNLFSPTVPLSHIDYDEQNITDGNYRKPINQDMTYFQLNISSYPSIISTENCC